MSGTLFPALPLDSGPQSAASIGEGITKIDFTIFYHAPQRLAASQPLYQPHDILEPRFSRHGAPSAPHARSSRGSHGVMS